jgi:DNA-binding SARP family transcriptional activator
MQLSVNGVQLDLGPARQRTVLAALAVDAGRPVAVDAVIDRVWGENPPAGARSGLYSYVTRLRRVLAAPGQATSMRLVSWSGSYVLDADRDRVDLCRYRALVTAARPDGDDERRAALLNEAITLWRGLPMAELNGGWVGRIRDMLAQQHVDTMISWAEVQLRLGRTRTVLAPLREAVSAHPLVEPLAARLIEALSRDGRASEALDRYARTRRQLVEELGIEPGPELRALHRSVLARDAVMPESAPRRRAG